MMLISHIYQINFISVVDIVVDKVVDKGVDIVVVKIKIVLIYYC